MKNIVIILVIMTSAINFAAAQGAGGTFIPTTSVYSGDLTTQKFQEKLSVIDAEISKAENKKAAELEKLEESFKANMPKAPKQKKEAAKAPEKKKYSYLEDINNSSDSVAKPVEKVVANNNFPEVMANYESKFEASKNAIAARYDALIEKLEAQKLAVLDAMANSKGNFVASTTSANNAANLYTAIKFADNMGNSGVNNNINNPGNGREVMRYIVNRSTNCSVTITSAPFNGITLNPGERSLIPYPIPVGVYSLAYNEYRNGTNLVVHRTMNIAVNANGGNLFIANR